MAIYNLGDKPATLPKTMAYDTDEKKYYSLTYRPSVWEANKAYINKKDVVMPASFNGFYYECVSGGVSGGTEPEFSTIEGQKTVDNSVEWVTKAYSFLLMPGDVITTSTWTLSPEETIDNDSIISGSQTRFRLTSSTAKSGATIKATNHIIVARANGDVEEFDRTILIPVLTL